MMQTRFNAISELERCVLDDINEHALSQNKVIIYDDSPSMECITSTPYATESGYREDSNFIAYTSAVKEFWKDKFDDRP